MNTHLYELQNSLDKCFEKFDIDSSTLSHEGKLAVRVEPDSTYEFKFTVHNSESIEGKRVTAIARILVMETYST